MISFEALSMKAKLIDKNRNVYIFSTDQQRPRRTKYSIWFVISIEILINTMFKEFSLIGNKISKDPGKIILSL